MACFWKHSGLYLLLPPTLIIRRCPKWKQKPKLLLSLCLQRSEICIQTTWGSGFLELCHYQPTSLALEPVCTCMCLIDSGWLLAHPGMRSKSNPIEMLVNAPLDCESKIAREEIQENIVSSDNLGNLPSGCFSMLSSTRLVTSVSK